MKAERRGPKYPTREEVDFVVIGSGAAGGVMAKELSEAGFSVVVLEQSDGCNNMLSRRTRGKPNERTAAGQLNSRSETVLHIHGRF